MRIGRPPDLPLLGIVWVLSLGPPAWAFLGMLQRPALTLPPKDGIAVLTLPPPRLPNREPVAAWALLDAAVESPSIAVAPEPLRPPGPSAAELLPDAGPQGLESRLRLHGYVGEGPERLYCFFDTRGDRWFRISAGTVDPDAGISLEVVPSAGLRLVDLESGDHYVIPPGKRTPREATR